MFKLVPNILLLIILSFSKEDSDKYAVLPLTISKDNFILCDFYLGSNNQRFRGILSTGTDLTWVSDIDSTNTDFDNLFNSTDSTSFKKGEEYSSEVLEYSFKKGNLATDKIKFDYSDQNKTQLSKEYSDFPFGLSTESVYPKLVSGDADGVLGFSEKSEFLKKLEKDLVKNKKAFSIEFTNMAGFIYFGSYSDIFLNHRSLSGFCFNKEKNSYNCRLSHIVFGDNTESDFKKNNKAIYENAFFHSGINEFVFPESYKSTFESKLSKCSFDNGYFYCDTMENKISFVFNGYVIKISNENFYEEKNGKYKLRIFFSGNKIFIGSLFFIEYKVLFDYEKGVNIFYNENKEKIGNVKYYTDDKDILFKEFLPQFSIGALIGLIFIGYSIFLCITKGKKGKEE